MQTDRNPMNLLIEMAHEMEQTGKIIQATVSGGFPYSDVQFAGLSIVVTTNGDINLARQKAREIANVAWDRRNEFVIANVPVREAVQEAMGAQDGPVVLVDVADNVGGGSPGDGTVILQELLHQRAQKAVVVIADQEAVKKAFSAGVGGRLQTELGGKTDLLHGDPVKISGVVRLLSDGIFHNRGSYSTGVRVDMGLTAVIQCNGVMIVLTSIKVLPFDPNHLYSVGIVPRDQKILVAKSAIAWKAAYGKEAKKAIYVDTPGLCTVQLNRFNYKNLRRPIFPLDSEGNTKWTFQFEEA